MSIIKISFQIKIGSLFQLPIKIPIKFSIIKSYSVVFMHFLINGNKIPPIALPKIIVKINATALQLAIPETAK